MQRKEEKMTRGQAVTVALVLAVAAGGGCVSKDTYQAAVRESEDVKADLDRERTQTKALEQHVKNLQEQSGKLAQESQLAAAEVQRLKESGSERTGIDGRIKELDVKLKEMAGQNRHLIAQTEELKKRNKALEAQVTRAQHELKDQSRSAAAMGAPPPGAKPAPKTAPPPPPPASTASKSPLDGAPPEPGTAGKPPQVAGAQPAPGQSMAQDAQSGPQGGKPPAEPPQEDMSILARIKRWLSSIWHMFF